MCRHKIELWYIKSQIVIKNHNEEYRLELKKETKMLSKENKFLSNGKQFAKEH